MADIYVKSGGGTIGSGSYRGNWTASQAYAVGDRICGVATSDYWMFECTTAGTAGSTEPTWTKTDGVTTTDNTVVWTARIPDTWADATLTLAKVAAIDAAGDTIYVSQSHAESSASAQTIALAGTAANPVRVICGNDAAEPPTTTATTAAVTTTGNSSITLTGSGYYRGIKFAVGSGATGAGATLTFGGSNSSMWLDSCAIELNTTSASQRIVVFPTANNGGVVSFNNCTFKFSNTGQGITPGRAFLMIDGCSIEAGSSAITTLFATTDSATQQVWVKHSDLSNMASSANLVVSGFSAAVKIDFINCKLPAAWSGGVVAGAPASPAFRASMYNCDSGSTNYRLWIETYAGSIKSETTLVKTGGASDGTTPLSWKLTTTANANDYTAPLITDDMAIWIDSTGSSKTITVDILHDSATALTDAEVWLEIDYLGSSSQPLGTPASDKRATVLTTAVDQNTSSATWTTTGMTNPNTQKLEITFTPQMKGFVYARVYLAKPSYTIYVDPKATVY